MRRSCACPHSPGYLLSRRPGMAEGAGAQALCLAGSPGGTGLGHTG